MFQDSGDMKIRATATIYLMIFLAFFISPVFAGTASITINNPVNTTYLEFPTFNYSITTDTAIDYCFYNLNDYSTIPLKSCQNFTVTYAHIPSNDLRLAYDFNANIANASTMYDKSKYGWNGTVTDATFNETGYYNGAYNFIRATDKIVIPDNPIVSGEDELTIFFWAKSMDFDHTYGYIIGKQYEMLPRISNGGRIYMTMYNSTGGVSAQTNAGTFKFDGNWHFVAITWKTGEQIKFYYDATEHLENPTYLNGTIRDYTGDFYIGMSYDEATSFINGTMDNLVILNRSLTFAELTEIRLNANRSVGFNTLELSLNLTDGDTALSAVNFTVGDEATPILSIQTPTNTTYDFNSTSGTNLTVNYTVSDNIAIDKCWMIHPDNSNISLSNCQNTTILLTAGSYSLQIWANDTSSNEILEEVNFTVRDITPPSVSIDLPLNDTSEYNPDGNNLSVNYQVSDIHGIANCYLINTTNDNISLPNCANSSIKVGLGHHTIKIIAEDNYGNVNDATRSFTIRDTAPPDMNLTLPLNITYAGYALLYFEVNDTAGINSCYYTLNDGAITDLPGCNNLSSFGILGSNNLKVYTNDTSNNTIMKAVNFTLELAGLYLRVYDEISENQLANLTLTMANTTSSITLGDLFVANISGDFNGGWSAGGQIAYDINLTQNIIRGVETNITINFTCTIGYGDTGTITIRRNGVGVGTWSQECLASPGTFGSLTSSAKFSADDQLTIYVSASDVNDPSITASNITTSSEEPDLYFRAFENLTGGETTLTFSKDDYSTRRYYRTFADNTRIDLNAYILSTTSGIWVRWHVKTTTEQDIEGALVQIRKFIADEYTIIEESESDASGTSSTFLDPTVIYRVNATKFGFLPNIFNKQPTNNDITIYLINSSMVANFTYLFDDIFMSIMPVERTVLNITNSTINFTISSTNNTLIYFGMNISLINGTLLFSNETISSSGGMVVGYLNLSGLNLSNTSQSSLNVTIYFSKTGYGIWTQNIIYYIHPTVEAGLPGILAVALPMFVKSLISLIITLVASLGVARFSTMGAGVVALASLGMMTVLGWFDPIIYGFILLAVFSIYVIKGM